MHPLPFHGRLNVSPQSIEGSHLPFGGALHTSHNTCTPHLMSWNTQILSWPVDNGRHDTRVLKRAQETAKGTWLTALHVALHTHSCSTK